MERAAVHPLVIRRRALAWMVVTTFFWGGSFVFNKIGFREVPPVTFLFLRFSLATLLLGLFTFHRIRRINRQIIWKGVAVGLALGATNLSFVLGVSGTSISRAGFLNNLFVLIIPLLCYFIWRERVSSATSAGIFLAAAGLCFLVSGGEAGFNAGDLLSTVCALFIAVHIIAVSRILTDEDVFLVSLVQFATVAAMGALLFLAYAPPFRPIGMVSAGAIIYCAIFPTLISFTLQNAWQRYTTPAQAGLIYTLDPIWSMLGGFVILGERLTITELGGCSLIFAGVVVPLLLQLFAERREAGSKMVERVS
jgi:drug/metabolite transporter (DMT)-like permease